MKVDQRGIGAVNVLLIIIVVALIGFAGWYVAKGNNKKDGNTSQSQSDASKQVKTKSYTDSANTYTVHVPEAWTVKEAMDCCEGPAKDYSKISRSVNVIPNDAVKNNALHVQADSGSDENKANWQGSGGSLAAHIQTQWQVNKQTPETKTINGYKAQYVKVHFKGDAEEYLDHRYLIVDGNRSVYLDFREFHDHPMSNNVWNDSKHRDDFEKIVNSVSFTKR